MATAFIATVLGLQFVAGFKLLAPPRSLPSLAPLRIAPAPALWPFLDYNMYDAAWYEGRAIDRPRLFGVTQDGTRIAITAEEVGLPFREFRDRMVNRLRAGDLAVAPEIMDRVAARRGVRLVALHVENHPAIVSREGLVDGPVKRERVVPR